MLTILMKVLKNKTLSSFLALIQLYTCKKKELASKITRDRIPRQYSHY